MSKSKTIIIDADKFAKSLEIDDLIKSQDKEVEIKGAALTDALCSYSYELLKGPTKGDTLTHKGAHIIHDDLQDKFNHLNVFFAHLDDAYTGITNATTLEELEQEPETKKYYVTGFRISGVEENRSIMLSGWKEVSEGIIKFDSPKINFKSAYLYLHQLKVRIYEAVFEVEEYRNGKSAPQDDPNQVNMEFEDDHDSFDKAKL
jgi:hypothetical protein